MFDPYEVFDADDDYCADAPSFDAAIVAVKTLEREGYLAPFRIEYRGRHVADAGTMQARNAPHPAFQILCDDTAETRRLMGR